MLFLSRSSSTSSSSTAWKYREFKQTNSFRAAHQSVCLTESCRDEQPDLSLVVADKHRSVTFHNWRRQRLEVTPEVAQTHVLRKTWETDRQRERGGDIRFVSTTIWIFKVKMIYNLTDLCSSLKSSNKLRDNSHPDSSEETGGNEEQRRGERNKWKYCSTQRLRLVKHKLCRLSGSHWGGGISN